MSLVSDPIQSGQARGGPPLLRLDNVSRQYKMGEVTVHALRSVSFEVPAGQFLAVVGPSGSGKSTILNLVGGLDRPTSGQVWYGGRELGQASPRELTEYRRRAVGFIFQFYNQPF